MHQKISIELSRQNVQSRFIRNLKMNWTLIDTPKNTIQGFVVDLRCMPLENIFNKVRRINIPKSLVDVTLYILRI